MTEYNIPFNRILTRVINWKYADNLRVSEAQVKYIQRKNAAEYRRRIVTRRRSMLLPLQMSGTLSTFKKRYVYRYYGDNSHVSV